MSSGVSERFCQLSGASIFLTGRQVAALVGLVVQEEVSLVVRQPALVTVAGGVIGLRADDHGVEVICHVDDGQGVASGVVPELRTGQKNQPVYHGMAWHGTAGAAWHMGTWHTP